LGGELGGKPGEGPAEHMSPLDHHQLLSVSRQVSRHYLECSAPTDTEHQSTADEAACVLA
jgi:hypothetical protein